MADSQQQQISKRHKSPWSDRARIALTALFAFLAFEALLFAAALQGPWLVLLAPAAVCGYKAAETYRRSGDGATPKPEH